MGDAFVCYDWATSLRRTAGLAKAVKKKESALAARPLDLGSTTRGRGLDTEVSR